MHEFYCDEIFDFGLFLGGYCGGCFRTFIFPFVAVVIFLLTLGVL